MDGGALHAPGDAEGLAAGAVEEAGGHQEALVAAERLPKLARLVHLLEGYLTVGAEGSAKMGVAI